MPLILPRRSLLTYPAGTAPGINPAHPAAQGIGGEQGISVVAVNGNFVDLTTGKKGAVLGAPTTAIQSHLGLGIKMTGAADAFDFANRATVITQTKQTFAAIVQFSTVPTGGFQTIFMSATDLSGGMFCLSSSGQPTIYEFNGGSVSTTALIPPVDTPILLAVSMSASTGVFNFIMADLRSGKISREVVSSANTGGVGNGTFRISSWDGSSPLAGTMAAAMFAPTYLTMPQLSAWAADPWAFWYPNKAQSLTGAATPVVTATVLYLMNVG